MTKIFFKANTISTKITEVEVIRETEKCVYTAGTDWHGKPEENRSNKRSAYSNYFATKEEAKEWLVEDATKNVEGKKRQLEYAQKRLDKILEL